VADKITLPMLISPRDLRHYWPKIRPMIEKAREKSPGTWLVEDVYMAAMQQNCRLYLLEENFEPKGVFIFLINDSILEKNCHVWIGYLEHPKWTIRQYFEWIKNKAKELNCQSVTTISSRPFHRVLKDVYIAGYQLRHDIK
jgi:hypothetical protein